MTVEGRDDKMELYLSPAGFDKVTSVIPCAPWLIRQHPEEAKTKPLLMSKSEEVLVKITMANLRPQ